MNGRQFIISGTPLPKETSNKRELFLERRAHVRTFSVDKFVLKSAECERSIYQRYSDLLVSGYPRSIFNSV